MSGGPHFTTAVTLDKAMRAMKRSFSLAISVALLFCCVFTVGCGKKELCDQIVEAIRTEDRDALKGYFSEQAINDCENIDAGIDYLFNYIQGDIEKIEFDAQHDSKSKDNDKVKSYTRKWYNITTSKETYVLFLLVYDRNDESPDSEGLYMAMICREGEDKSEPYLYPGEETLCAGVYIPS